MALFFDGDETNPFSGRGKRLRLPRMTKRSQPGLASSHQIIVRDETKPSAILAGGGFCLLWVGRMVYGDGFPGASAVDRLASRSRWIGRTF